MGDELREWYRRLVREVDLPKDAARLPEDELQVHLREEATRRLGQWNPPLNRMERERVVELVMDELLGLGPLQGLVRDPEVSRIVVSAPDAIRVVRKGREVAASGWEVSFEDRRHLARVVDRLLDRARREGQLVPEPPHGFRGELPGYLRFVATVPPLDLASPTVAIDLG